MKLTELETDKESKLLSEIELEKMKHGFEMKHLELMGQLEVQRTSFKTELEKQKSEKLVHARDPKLPYFEERKNKIDSYLSRSEKYATENKWDKNVWAAYLNASLEVRALDIYTLRKRLRIRSVISVNCHYIIVLCPFNLSIRFKCYNSV